MKPIQFDVAMLQLSNERTDVFDLAQFCPSPPLGDTGGFDGASELAQQVPKTACPNCGQWVDDFDGFGVLTHEECGYCSHPASLINDDGTLTCEVCGHTFDEPKPCQHLNCMEVANEKGGRVLVCLTCGAVRPGGF